MELIAEKKLSINQTSLPRFCSRLNLLCCEIFGAQALHQGGSKKKKQANSRIANLQRCKFPNCKDKSANNPARRGFITTVDIYDGQYSIFPEGIDQDFNLPVCFCRTPDGA
ncbi:hypothetical protein T03_14131 [Trichinella britovi]|uniref:Uncharacterized protein n=1 Tax=Trichinella britovi TaxID=45882 RepID=A0A0V1DHC9_TRIBR|nr:hypothetical protein T03_14131 [Trichinella britovi]